MEYLFLSFFACIGLVCAVTELVRLCRKKDMRFTCLLFGDGAKTALEEQSYTVVFLCRSELEEQEIIRRLSEGEKRKIYIRRW